MNKQDILDAWATIRKTNSSIPDDVLDFMKDSSVAALEANEIKLSDVDKEVILFCKGHMKDQYPLDGKWINMLKPFYKDRYGLDPDEYPRDYRRCMFYKLHSIQVKLADNDYARTRETQEVFTSAFEQSIIRNDEQPIERAISNLCGIIQCSSYLDKNGNPRYSLELNNGGK